MNNLIAEIRALAKEIRSKKWYEFSDTVTLYHGTSSAFLSDIKRDGLTPPSEEVESFVYETLDAYAADPNFSLSDDAYNELAEKIVKRILDFRHNVGDVKTLNVVYLTARFDGAKDYAEAYYQVGGEIGTDIFSALKQYAKQQGVQLKPRYAKAHPVVVEVEVPFQWMKTYRNINSIHKRALETWESMQSWYAERGITTFNDFLEKEATDFEVRVEQTIPPKMITKVTKV